ncbi:hypothetical protein C6A85_10585, partial [Mycobacterium sp. ITM-2017-0098]
AAVALVGAGTAGVVIVRRQLAPLARVSAAAQQVADLELDRGEDRHHPHERVVDVGGRQPRDHGFAGDMGREGDHAIAAQP